MSDYDEKTNDSGSDDDSDEYVEGLAPTRKRTRPSFATTKTTPSRKRTRNHSLSKNEDLSSDDTNQRRPLTARQQKTCLTTFALFFPEASEQDLPFQRIMIKDIQRVAKLLGEKIKAEDVVEMVNMFSTSADKSMSLDDFGRMMVAARLA